MCGTVKKPWDCRSIKFKSKDGNCAADQSFIGKAEATIASWYVPAATWYFHVCAL